jgi:hypothetical protein
MEALKSFYILELKSFKIELRSNAISSILKVESNIFGSSYVNYLLIVFQDGVEFSTPRIHSPVYDVNTGCFSSGDVYDFEKNLRLNQPLKMSSTSLLKSYSSWLLLTIILYSLL